MKHPDQETGMPTPPRWYHIEVCRDPAGVLQTRLRTQPGVSSGEWCGHSLVARSRKKAEQKAKAEHVAHEGHYFGELLGEHLRHRG